MPEFKVQYLCTLTVGCGHKGHSLSCQEANKRYAEAQRAAERKRRLAVIENAVNPDPRYAP